MAAAIAAYVAWTSWQRRESPGNRPLAFLMLALLIWSLNYAIWWLRLPGPTAFFWLDLTYVGVVMVPLTFLSFAIRFTGNDHLLDQRRLIWLSLLPIIILVLLWTDPVWGLFFGDVSRSQDIGTIFAGGIGFYLNVLYGYTVIFTGVFFIVRGFIRAKGLYRQQMAAILVAAFFPFLSNITSLLGYNPFPQLDLTPITFTITGSVFAFALHRLGLLDVVPIARYTLVEEMSDGVLVLDAQNRIVDVNPAAERLLTTLGPAPIGKPAIDLLAPWPELQERFRGEVESHQQVTLPGDTEVTLDLRISPLHSSNNILKGRLIIIRDISDRVRIEKELRKANRRQQQQIAEVEKLQAQLREQAIRDSLTGVFNRRYLEESLAREIAQLRRDERPLSVAMLDIDDFKTFNDTHGHAAGDSMLLALARILQENTRAGDIVCRFGGEEFIIVLPGAPLDIALLRIEYLRQTFEMRVVEHGGERLQSTLSAGVALFPEHGDSVEGLLAAADEAMYRAKQAGRNQVHPAS